MSYRYRDQKETVRCYSELICLVVDRYPINVGIPLALLLSQECMKVVAGIEGWDDDLYTEYENGKAFKCEAEAFAQRMQYKNGEVRVALNILRS